MADYYNNNTSYAGVYTEKEKAWLTILRYGGFLLFGAGIYGFVSRRLPVAVSVVALVLAVVCTTVNVWIMQTGIERRKIMNARQKRKKKY
ncbi:MAG: hypothetical protein DBY22_08260 [Clostridiales bacterium]|nr:MAG: hypothetical protein DBY22_08260 [Clostridiales bacterium]